MVFLVTHTVPIKNQSLTENLVLLTQRKVILVRKVIPLNLEVVEDENYFIIFINMKGFFFGSFDPPHIGHVNVVTAALNSGLVDSVEVIPAFKSVWKNTETPWNYRLIMCQLTFNKIPGVSVNSVEYYLADNKPLPTYKVIDFLKEHEKEDFYIVTTNETYKEIKVWQEGERILKENKFIIVCSYHFPEILELGINDTIVHAPTITICSTSIRQRLKKGEIIQPFMLPNVIHFINDTELYK